MRPVLKWVVTVGLVAGLAVGGCDAGEGDGSGDNGGDEGRPLVVATTAVLGDVVGKLAGGDLDVETLMPRGADPHSFEASARQAAGLRDADLVVANGLGLEERLLDAIDSARDDGVPVLEIGPLVDPVRIGEGGERGEGEFDPHVWMDPLRMEQAVAAIGERLGEVAPGTDWAARARAYRSEIRRTHEEVDRALAAISRDRRKLVTDHDSLRYFADRYGFEVVGTVVPGTSTLGAPSAGDLSRLADLVRDAGVPAIFVETTQATRLADALAREVGADVEVVTLFAGTLDEPSSPAGTFLGMLTADARRIAEALS